MHVQTAHPREEAKPEMITPSRSRGDSRRPGDGSEVTGEAGQQILPSQARSGSPQLMLLPLTAVGIVRADQAPDSSWKVREGFPEVVAHRMGPEGGTEVGQTRR